MQMSGLVLQHIQQFVEGFMRKLVWEGLVAMFVM